jgi:Domain of Unknown Function with PDB structure (DUF3857)/Transglutaminase-like superfamily
MFSIKTPTFLLLFLIISFNILAQKPAPIEFGKIPIEDLQMVVYPKDSTAEAVVLCDYGQYSFMFPYNSPMSINYRRHIRIKILKKAGFDRASVKIAYLMGELKRSESIRNLKAVTYNLEDGIMKSYRLEEKSIFNEKSSKNLYYQTFTLPQVREGSVIEYSYDLDSEVWYNLRTWDFQKNIPVVWSELRAVIPAYFNFNLTYQSTFPLNINENEEGEDNFLRGSIRDKYIKYRLALKDVPALRAEPFVTTIENFRSKLDFELAATYFPDDIKRNYSQTWEALSETLLTNENFGKQIKKFDAAEGVATLLKTQHKDTLALATAAYKYIQNTMQWNDEESAFTTDANLNKTYEKRTGNSAEINLMLVRLLRECGIEANPVILSTRSNGKASDLVLLDRFNYTIAHIVLKNKDFLLDATNGLLTFGMLPMHCLNERGRLISKKNSRWIAIKPEPIRRKIIINEMKISTDQNIKGSSRISYTGHNGVDFRTSVLKKGKDNFMSEYKKNRPNQTVESIQIINLDSLEELAELNVKTTYNEAYTIAGDRVYFSPMLGNGETSNPFKVKERKYPVDFGVPEEENYVASFLIPDTYTVEELPKQENVVLPNNGGRFLYSCQLDGNTLKIISKITLKRAVYSEEEYAFLREFYNRIVSKHAEQVVLKKK